MERNCYVLADCMFLDRHLFPRLLPVRTNDTSAVRYCQPTRSTRWS